MAGECNNYPLSDWDFINNRPVATETAAPTEPLQPWIEVAAVMICDTIDGVYEDRQKARDRCAAIVRAQFEKILSLQISEGFRGHLPRQDIGATFRDLGEKIDSVSTDGRNANPAIYSWAGTYSAGSDALVYRRFKGPLPAHVPVIFARDNPPTRIVAFCEENNCDVALYDELRGIVRKPRLGTDEAP